MRPVPIDVQMLTRKIIHLHHLRAEFTPIGLHGMIGLEDYDLSRIDLRNILSRRLKNHPEGIKSSERCGQGIT